MKKIALILAILVLIVFLIIGIRILFTWDSPYYERESSTLEEVTQELEELVDEETDTITEESAQKNLYGTIEGSLSYPSEYIPPLEICADSVDSSEQYCTYEHIESAKYTYGQGYKIEAPAGKYTVYAKLLNPDDDYKAYYSQFVTCGMEYECEDHEPIEITVTAGETLSSIDPMDWYAPQE